MRERGLYWVRFKSSLPDVEPEIAFWRDEQFGWVCSGQNESCNDLELEVLSERLVPPGAPSRRLGLRCDNHTAELGYTCTNCVVTPRLEAKGRSPESKSRPGRSPKTGRRRP